MRQHGKCRRRRGLTIASEYPKHGHGLSCQKQYGEEVDEDIEFCVATPCKSSQQAFKKIAGTLRNRDVWLGSG
jgi:hypothetical protein